MKNHDKDTTRSCSEACDKTKKRTEIEYKDLINRLSRIEGQVRGVKGMLEKDAYCIDIINQVTAINAALNSFNKVLLENHIRSCVKEGIENSDHQKVDELVKLLNKIIK